MKLYDIINLCNTSQVRVYDGDLVHYYWYSYEEQMYLYDNTYDIYYDEEYIYGNDFNIQCMNVDCITVDADRYICIYVSTDD